MELHFISKDLGFFGKVGYWLRKTGIVSYKTLKEFKIDDNNVFVSTFEGDELSAPIGECNIYYVSDKDGASVLIKYGDTQIDIDENPQMEKSDEWKKIKEFLKEHQSTTFDFVTHEPKWWQKLMQMYWFVPKSVRLDRFHYDGENLYASTMNGKELSAPLSECTIEHEVDDKNKRIDIIIKRGNDKLRFREVGFMLDDTEWDIIKHFVLVTCKSKMSTRGKALSAATKVLELFKD